MTERELKPNGRNIAVTEKNKKDYNMNINDVVMNINDVINRCLVRWLREN